MEKEIAFGSEGSVDFKFSAGRLVVEVKHSHASGEAMIVVSEDVSYFIDKLAAAIPGTMDDAILALIKSAIKALP